MSITVWKPIEVEVNIDVSDLDFDDIKQILCEAVKRGKLVDCFPVGDGDAAHIETIIERAFIATRRLPAVPQELADMFYIVHGRACS